MLKNERLHGLMQTPSPMHPLSITSSPRRAPEAHAQPLSTSFSPIPSPTPSSRLSTRFSGGLSSRFSCISLMISCASRANLHRFRIAGPYLKNKNGNGTQARAKKAGMLLAQWMPRASYMYVVKRGKMAPKRLRRTLLAARTLAA